MAKCQDDIASDASELEAEVSATLWRIRLINKQISGVKKHKREAEQALAHVGVWGVWWPQVFYYANVFVPEPRLFCILYIPYIGLGWSWHLLQGPPARRDIGAEALRGSQDGREGSPGVSYNSIMTNPPVPCALIHPSTCCLLPLPYRLQDALKQKMEIGSVRYSPLGIDRRGRRYW